MSVVTPPAPGFVTLPNIVRIVLSIVASVAAALNLSTFGVGGDAAVYVSAGLAGLATIGIAPVTGNALQDLLLQIFPAQVVQTIHGVVAAAVVVGTALAGNAHWSSHLSAIVVGVVTALGGLLGGPAGTEPVAPRARPARASKHPLARLKSWAASGEVHKKTA